jgi:hypothetical protein
MVMELQKLSYVIITFFVLLTCFSCDKDVVNEPIKFNKEISYYNGDSLIHLDINPQMILVAFKEESYSKPQAMNILKNFSEIDLNSDTICARNRIFVYLKNGLTEDNYLKLLVQLNSIESVEYATPSFLVDNGRMFLTNKLFIETTKSENEFETFLKDNSAYFSKVENYSAGNLFIVNKVETGFEVLDYANKINELDDIEYSSPSFSYLLDPFDNK